MPLTDNHEHGAFLISRSLFESDIWAKPPDYAKLWVYLIGRACHKDVKYRGYSLKRGQSFCTIAELTEQIRYHIGYRPKKLSESRVKHILRFLRKTGRITSTREPRGMVITLLKYDQYQKLEHYGRTKERSAERPKHEPEANDKPLSINKKVKNERKIIDVDLRKKILKHFGELGIEYPEAYLRKLESQCTPSAIKKAWNDWNRGGGINSIGDFYSRCLHYTKKEGEQSSRESQ